MLGEPGTHTQVKGGSSDLDGVVRRGFGGAYLFTLFPIPVFLFGVWSLRAFASR